MPHLIESLLEVEKGGSCFVSLFKIKRNVIYDVEKLGDHHVIWSVAMLFR